MIQGTMPYGVISCLGGGLRSLSAFLVIIVIIFFSSCSSLLHLHVTHSLLPNCSHNVQVVMTDIQHVSNLSLTYKVSI